MSYNSGNTNDRLKYSSKELDEGMGLSKYHFGWRDYDPEIGRWHVKDPLYWLTPGQTPYNYCSNDPVNRIDILGLGEPSGGWFYITNNGKVVFSCYVPKGWTVEVNHGNTETTESTVKREGDKNNSHVDLWGSDILDGGIDGDYLDAIHNSGRGCVPMGGGIRDRRGRRPRSGSSGIGLNAANIAANAAGIYTTLSAANYVNSGYYYSSLFGKWYSMGYYGNDFYSSLARSETLLSAKAFTRAGKILFWASAFVSSYESVMYYNQGDYVRGTRSLTDIGASALMTYGSPIGIFYGGSYFLMRYLPPQVYYDMGQQYNKICFAAGTKITMGDGSFKNIENIKIGDIVKSYNFKTNELENTKVLKIDTPHHKNFVKIIFSNEIVNINTLDHPYFVIEKGWCSYAPKETVLSMV